MQYVGNRVRKIREHADVVWRHVPSSDNPADLASRDGHLTEDDQLWWNRSYLADGSLKLATRYCDNINLWDRCGDENLDVNTGDQLDHFLDKSALWQALTVSAWIARFWFNSRVPKEQHRKGELSTIDLNEQMQYVERRAQLRCTGLDNEEEDRECEQMTKVRGNKLDTTTWTTYETARCMLRIAKHLI